jgi:GT2 family glycosyltransferase
MVRVSVIIPTYRREAPLRRCLIDVLAQQHPAFEVLVMDQSPDHDAETWALLNACASHIRHVRLTQPSVTVACNQGVALARGETLLFLDDDIEIPHDQLLALHEHHYANSRIGGVVGRVMNPLRGTTLPPPVLRQGALAILDMNFDHPQAMDVPTTQGCNMSFRRSLVLALGGFDDSYTGNAFCWETDFSLQVIRRGLRIRYDPEARIIHRSGTLGGCDNRHFGGRTPESHRYYVSFFRNNAYFALKQLHGADRLRFLWHRYREHAMNRPLLTLGVRFGLQRHAAVLYGVFQGWQAWWCRRP